jgi:GMP synthase (glutamine-hydrolysing)
MAKSCIALQHIHPEDLGSFEQPIRMAGYEITYLPAPTATSAEHEKALTADLLVVLGGPIGVYDIDIYPFLRAEQAVVETRLSKRLPLLGLCLGAQLMAKAAGSRVYPSGTHEIGWFPLRRAVDLPEDCPSRHLFGSNEEVPMIHWHGDTYDLPPSARRLASTALVREQGFMIGNYAMAWQCHPEFLETNLEHWLVTHAHELNERGGEQLIAQIRNDTSRWGAELAVRGRKMITSWLERL